MTPQGIVICLLVGALVLPLALRRLDRAEQRIVTGAFALHIAAAIALVVYHEHIFQGGGDMQMYAMHGKLIAYVIDRNPVRWGTETIKLALQLENDLPVEVIGAGVSTGTMSALAGLLMYGVGDTLYAVGCLIAFFSFWGSVQLYRAVRPTLELPERVPVMAGLLLVPSVVFWTSGLVKEAFVVGFLGVACKALADLLTRRRIVALLPLLISVEGMAVTKPYVLVSLAIAMGGWFYAKRKRGLGVVYKLVGVVAAGGAVLLVASRFPEFSPENIGESVARSQQNYAFVAGAGSNIEIGDADAPQGIVGQLKWAPLGLLNSLARPFLFEARNVAMLLAALETTFLIVVAVTLVKAHGPRRILAEIRRHPALLFASVLVLTFGISVGLATKNLGTLSRYRVPMMPVYVASVLLLRARLRKSLPARKVVSPGRQLASTRGATTMRRVSR